MGYPLSPYNVNFAALAFKRVMRPLTQQGTIMPFPTHGPVQMPNRSIPLIENMFQKERQYTDHEVETLLVLFMQSYNTT